MNICSANIIQYFVTCRKLINFYLKVNFTVNQSLNLDFNYEKDKLSNKNNTNRKFIY